MKPKNHTHKLKSHIYPTGNAIYFCTLTDCYFKIDCPLALGKESICNVCGMEFIMTEYTIKLHLPSCNNCRKVKVSGSDGKKHYVRRDSTPVVASLASDNAEDLRSRLNSAISKPTEDDI